MLRDKGQSIDLGGIAKGYVLDKIKNILSSNNINNAIINLGGSVISIGEVRNIGIRNPFTPMNEFKKQSIFASLQTVDECIVTSGIYEQYFKKDGEIYHHILSPLTGYPTKTELISATIVGNCGAELDALATACFVLGLEKSVKLIQNENLNAVFILENGSIFITEGLKEKFKLEGDI
jgi:thiamine biosynthesis lipoprotein